MTVLEIINEPGFQRIAAILRVPFWSLSWKREHPDVPFWTLWRNIEMSEDREDVLETLTDALMQIANATERLRYNTEDMEWLVRTLDEENWQTWIAMLLAFASAPDVLYAPSELASVTSIAESTWRKYAATGFVIGSIKKGKQWLLPKSVLVAQGLLTQEQAAQLIRQPAD